MKPRLPDYKVSLHCCLTQHSPPGGVKNTHFHIYCTIRSQKSIKKRVLSRSWSSYRQTCKINKQNNWYDLFINIFALCVFGWTEIVTVVLFYSSAHLNCSIFMFFIIFSFYLGIENKHKVSYTFFEYTTIVNKRDDYFIIILNFINGCSCNVVTMLLTVCGVYFILIWIQERTNIFIIPKN